MPFLELAIISILSDILYPIIANKIDQYPLDHPTYFNHLNPAYQRELTNGTQISCETPFGIVMVTFVIRGLSLLSAHTIGIIFVRVWYA